MNEKERKYELLCKQVQALAEGETDEIALMANMCAAIQDTFRFWWTGFYRVIGEELVLGPFQGPLACTRIAYGKGVCGNAWQEQRTLVVPDVHQFKGHIACSSLSNSEIVVPLHDGKGQVCGVLDIDSEDFGTFDLTDAMWLEKIAAII